MNIDLQDTITLFEALASYGRTESGGLTRLSYSPEYTAAQNFLRQYMTDLGMLTETDEVGNLIGTYIGRDSSLPAVCCGSHLDTVPEGGAFDGALGIVSALSCLTAWHKSGWQPLRNVKVLALIEEEGTRFGAVCFGSKALTGELANCVPADIVTASGQTWQALAQKAGLAGKTFGQHNLLENCACFLELHIEQGDILAAEEIPVGLVSAICGIKRFNLCLKGAANHAGTTTMPRRHDALVAAAALITSVYENALHSRGQYVATVGQITVLPNAGNVIPGEVHLTVEMRAPLTATLEAAAEHFTSAFASLEDKYGVKLTVSHEAFVPPLPLDTQLLTILAEEYAALGIAYRSLPSGAGHDSMIIGRYLPTAMIFVPSQAGISHSPLEKSSWHDIEKSLKVLNNTLQKLSSLPANSL